MLKRVSKADLSKIIKDADTLEIIFDVINRSGSSSAKLSSLSKFVNEVKEQIKDERDILLISIKVK